MPELTNEQYLESFRSVMNGPDDSEIRLQTHRLVTTRKEHECLCCYCGGMHKIPPGSRAAVERALVDGVWNQTYNCLPCLERWYKICHESDYPAVDKPCPCKSAEASE